jgi:glycosyltransferase involved in cell wall biosynthesis
MEGGADVISEAVVAGLPVIASEISGSVGLLGGDYPGYYPVEDTTQLRDILLRAETDPGFLASLEHCCKQRQSLFTPQREAQGWKALLKTL